MRKSGGNDAARRRRDLHRNVAVLRAVVAKLAVGVPSPRPDRAVGLAREGVKAAAAIAATPVNPLTCTGAFRSVKLPSPSWPASLRPMPKPFRRPERQAVPVAASDGDDAGK